VQTKNVKNIILLSSIVTLTIQFLYDRSLYIDEAALGLNILQRNYAELLQPLSSFQVTPILFLLVTEFLSNTFGHSTIVLRLIPFLFSILSLLFIYPTSYGITKSRHTALTCLILLAFSPLFYRYSTEFKQYAIDLSLTVIFLWHVFKKENISLTIPFVLISSISIFISHISIFLLFLLGIYLMYIRLKRKISILPLLTVGSIWVLCFLFYYYNFITEHPSEKHQVDFWQYAFMPTRPYDIIVWFPKRFFTIFYNFFAYNIFLIPAIKYRLVFLPFLTMVPFFIGIYSTLRKKQYKVLYFCLAPIGLHLILSCLEIYPYSVRNTYYQLVMYFLLFSIGINHLFSNQKIRSKVKKYIIIFSVIIYLIFFLINFPFNLENVKPVINKVQLIKKDHQGLYIFKDIRGIYKYYLGINYLPIISNTVIGNINIDNLQNLDRELETIPTNETWYIFGNENQMNTRKGHLDFNSNVLNGTQFLSTDKTFILEYLKNKNYELKDSIIDKGSSAYLIVANR